MVADGLFSLDILDPPGLPDGTIEHGEVFTRRWIVDMILDLVSYDTRRNLAHMKIVEPACGSGAFLDAIAERISASCRAHDTPIIDALDAVHAFDLLDRNVKASRALVAARLTRDGWPKADAEKVAQNWVNQGDYLLDENDSEQADFVVGNPPYIRLEDIPDARMKAYRRACPTMSGRADIYIGFFEKGLRSLTPNGKLGFICADRWMRNQYGGRLRELIGRRYGLDLTISLHDVDAFEDQVSAYPAISIIRNGQQGSTVVADTTANFGPVEAKQFELWAAQEDSTGVHNQAFHACRMPHWFKGEDSWPNGSPERLAMLEDLCDRFPQLEDENTGTRVGIGIATGADGIFIAHPGSEIDIEADRLLPLSMVKDTRDGRLRWGGTYLVNPWDSAGDLVDLEDYPLLAAHFDKHAAILRQRYVATKQPQRWFKTIDKVSHDLTRRPKLLFPDMKMTIHPVLDPGGHYPHHNLYYVVSDAWEMKVLGGLLLSKVAEAFISAYAVRMRGGTLRFQAQYLRKIRVPRPQDIDPVEQRALSEAFDARDVDAATAAALRVYGLKTLPD